MYDIPHIMQLLTPTPPPPPVGTAPIAIDTALTDDLAISTVGIWQQMDAAGIVTTIQILVIIFILIGGFVLITRAVRDL